MINKTGCEVSFQGHNPAKCTFPNAELPLRLLVRHETLGLNGFEWLGAARCLEPLETPQSQHKIPSLYQLLWKPGVVPSTSFCSTSRLVTG